MVLHQPSLEREPFRRTEVGAEKGLRETLREGCRVVWTKTHALLTGARDTRTGTERVAGGDAERGSKEAGFEFTQPVRITLPDGKIETWMVVSVPTDRSGKYGIMPFGRRMSDTRRFVSFEELKKLNRPVPSVDLKRSKIRNPFYHGEEVYQLLPMGNGVAEKGWRVVHDQNADTWFVEKPSKAMMSDGETVDATLRRAFEPEMTAHLYEVEENGTRDTLPDNPNFLLQKRALEFGKKGNLSKAMVDRLFEGSIEQQNVGNCYLLAALHSLRQCPYFDVLMSRAIRKQKDGWIVRFPLGSEKPGKEISVSNAELSQVQVVEVPGGGRQELMPLKGSDGWRLLEAAYTKLVTGSMNRDATSGGNSSPALQEMFGKAVDPSWESPIKHDEYISKDIARIQRVTTFLQHFHPGKDIATCATPLPPKQEAGKMAYTKQSFTGPVVLLRQHGYSIESVDNFNKIVVVKNPLDTSTPLVFTFEQFCDAFHAVDRVELSRENLFTENEMPPVKHRGTPATPRPLPQPPSRTRTIAPPPPPPPRRGGKAPAPHPLQSRSGRGNTGDVFRNN